MCGLSPDVLGVMGWRVGNQHPRLWRTSHPGRVDERASGP